MYAFCIKFTFRRTFLRRKKKRFENKKLEIRNTLQNVMAGIILIVLVVLVVVVVVVVVVDFCLLMFLTIEFRKYERKHRI